MPIKKQTQLKLENEYLIAALNLIKKLIASPRDKILDRSKLKAFADNIINADVMVFVCERLENVGKGEKSSYIFSFSHHVFKSFFLRVIKNWDYEDKSWIYNTPKAVFMLKSCEHKILIFEH